MFDHSRYIPGLYWLWLSNAAPVFENYGNLCFDAKHLLKGLNRAGGGGVGILGPCLQKSALFS